MQVVIIDYGAGNLFSVAKAFERLGIVPIISSDPTVITSADRVIFPGVGHAKTAMDQLKLSGLDKVLPLLTQPVLGICLGMQLMCKSTEEGDVQGLGIFDTKVVDFRTTKRKNRLQNENLAKQLSVLHYPHMGWNDVKFPESQETFYFVHNYAAEICEDTWGIGSYGIDFSAALRKENFYGVQFHPEKSGLAGELILSDFLLGNFTNLQFCKNAKKSIFTDFNTEL